MKRCVLASLVAFLLGGGHDGMAKDKKDKDNPAKPAKIKVSAKPGFREERTDVTLSCATAGLQIYYTTDGRIPSPQNGTLYRGPIPITTTMPLRAAGYQEGRLVTEIDTHTFLFLAGILKQTGAGAPATWGTNQGKAVPADYEMDPEIVQAPEYARALPGALRALPSLCVTMDPDDLFGAAPGIYANPRQSGNDWERAASIEFLPATEGKAFEANCGIRIQGGWNRRPEESPKHAFRLAFRKKYGVGKLKQPLFAGPGADEFDTLILRAGCNNTWLHWSGRERRQGDYLRDQWMRLSQAAMGHASARGIFVHLYLNGLYWGLYNLTERPDERLAADFFGGDPKDYDARNGENILSGDDTAWKRLLTLINGGVKDAAAAQAVDDLLDLPAFIDFMILNLYGGNADWDHASNWYAARRRNPPGAFHFFVWDGERTLEQADANTLAFDDDQSPPRLFQKLRENEEFRVRFGDRVQRHLSEGGALSPGAAAARFRAESDRLDAPIIAESARWGDYRRDVHPYKEGPYELYTRDRHWRPEIQRVLKDFFPKRTEEMFAQFREAGLYPTVAAPVGRKEGEKWSLSAVAGTIYFTEDGSDPRLAGGKLSDRARRYAEPISLQPARKLQARAMTVTAAGGAPQWSALVEP